MHQFIYATYEQVEHLDSQLSRASVRFRDQALPPGCTPATADIVFERRRREGIRLLVARGINYEGDNVTVREWLRGGRLEFADRRALLRFFNEDLPRWFATPRSGAGTAATAVRVEPSNVADREHDVASRAMPECPIDQATAQLHTARGPAPIQPEPLAQRLAERVQGQGEALAVIARRAVAHVNRVAPKRPATLFFVGPTGVGKTLTAEQLAQELTRLRPAEPWGYLRLDMNEYREPHRVSQMLGAPPGYVGYNERPVLAGTQLQAHPASVILFDEIEKAHPDFLLVLMNAMDAGRLSLPAPFNGQSVLDCRRAIFVFTSNLEASGILSELDALGPTADASQIDGICRRRLRAQGVPPEIVARVSSFAVFRPFRGEDRLRVLLAAIASVASEYGVQVARVAPESLVALAGGSDGASGARHDEYRVDALLGEQFAQAWAGGHRTVELIGVPPRAQPVQDELRLAESALGPQEGCEASSEPPTP